MGIDLEECLKTANMQAFYSDPYSLRASTQIKALCQEVERLREEIGTYRLQEESENKLIAKIEILEAKNETLRELVGEDSNLIQDFVSLGYDLHIYDQSGSYPDGLDRDEWIQQETERIFKENSAPK